MSATRTKPALFPIFLKLDGVPVLLVGAGKVAATKLDALLAAGAHVTVVAPEVARSIERPGVRVVRRRFDAGDVDGAWLVVAAAPPEVNRKVVEAAERRRVFVNAADDPRHASAFLGGVVRKGGVTIAVSTEGHAPALAGLLREGLEATLPDEVDTWLAEAEDARRRWREEGTAFEERRPLLLAAINRIYEEKRVALTGGKT